MLSRVAENLYWLGRYLERGENTARFINSTTQVLLDLPKSASFGWDVLLTVAVEIAFSVATARAAVGVEREGWLSAAVRLTWKPLLGALVCAVLLGATIDHFLPHVHSLPEALRVIQGR